MMNKINSSYCLNLLMAIISNRTIEFKFYILLKKEKKEFKFYILRTKFKNKRTREKSWCITHILVEIIMSAKI